VHRDPEISRARADLGEVLYDRVAFGNEPRVKTDSNAHEAPWARDRGVLASFVTCFRKLASDIHASLPLGRRALSSGGRFEEPLALRQLVGNQVLSR
jgi:hypothetical protein